MTNPVLARLPLWVRNAINDTVEGFIAAVLLLTAAQVHEAGVNAFGVALLHAGISALRRNLPDALAWLRDQLGVGD